MHFQKKRESSSSLTSIYLVLVTLRCACWSNFLKKKIAWIILSQHMNLHKSAKICFQNVVYHKMFHNCVCSAKTHFLTITTYLMNNILANHFCRFFAFYKGLSLNPADTALFRNKRFILNLIPQRNALKFAIFLTFENLSSFFVFHFMQLYLFL